MKAARFLLVLQASILLLIVSIWFPGATQIAGTDGSLSFLLALFCATIGVAVYREAARGLHSADAAFMVILLSAAGLIIVLSLLSMLYAASPIRTLRTVFAHIFGFALVPTTAAISARPGGTDAVERIVSVFMAMGVLTACLVIAGLGDAKFADRAEGYFKHANQLGIAMSAALPLVAARLVASHKHRVVLLGCVLAIVMGLIESGSKTNFVVGVVGLALFFGLYGTYLAVRRRRPITLIAGAIVTPVIVQGALSLLQSFNPRAYRLLLLQFSGGDPHSMVARERLWAMSIDLGLANPFTGVGAGQPLGDIAPHSHNLFVEYFRTLGVPGAAMITVIVLVVALYLASAVLHTLFRGECGPRGERANVMLLGAAVSVWNYLLANQMSDSFGPSTAAFFWLPVALLITYRGMQRSLLAGYHRRHLAELAAAPRPSRRAVTGDQGQRFA